jgi:hypothetical protein
MRTLRLRATALDWREVDGEIVALEAATATYLGGNRTATTLWRALAEGTSREQLVDRLRAEFGVEAETAGRDVDAFVAELDSRGLLEP